MLFYCIMASSPDVMKLVSKFTIREFIVDLKVKTFKQLARDDTFITTIATIKWETEIEIGTIHKLTKAELKHTELSYNVILSFMKWRLLVRNEKKKEEESRQLE